MPETYVPRPIDTDAVELDGALLSLTERLAEHAHDLWARQRIGEGWTYGEWRDDAARRHPDLRPYAELADSEREYDRLIAMGTLKAILSLGWRLVPPR